MEMNSKKSTGTIEQEIEFEEIDRNNAGNSSAGADSSNHEVVAAMKKCVDHPRASDAVR